MILPARTRECERELEALCVEGLDDEVELNEPDPSRLEAAADPVDRIEGGLRCERMECKEPCSEGTRCGCVN